jgi:choline/glycine/proline betaine transport protein
MNAWTVFFWAWWMAWGPFVGLFLARISRGHTIREFVVGTLLLPLAFMMAWMSIMGNSAIDLVMNGAVEFGAQAVSNPGSSIYLFLQSLPWAGLTTSVATVLAIVFFVTSGDSGSLVLSNFTSILRDANSDAPVWMRILWAAIIGVLTLALLIAGGLSALQGTVVIMGLPFSIVLLFMMVGLFKALHVEGVMADSYQKSLSGQLSGRATLEHAHMNWSQRLSRAMSFPSQSQTSGHGRNPEGARREGRTGGDCRRRARQRAPDPQRESRQRDGLHLPDLARSQLHAVFCGAHLQQQCALLPA